MGRHLNFNRGLTSVSPQRKENKMDKFEIKVFYIKNHFSDGRFTHGNEENIVCSSSDKSVLSAWLEEKIDAMLFLDSDDLSYDDVMVRCENTGKFMCVELEDDLGDCKDFIELITDPQPILNIKSAWAE